MIKGGLWLSVTLVVEIFATNVLNVISTEIAFLVLCVVIAPFTEELCRARGGPFYTIMIITIEGVAIASSAIALFSHNIVIAVVFAVITLGSRYIHVLLHKMHHVYNISIPIAVHAVTNASAIGVVFGSFFIGIEHDATLLILAMSTMFAIIITTKVIFLSGDNNINFF